MKVILSIKPEFVEKIISNEKKYEFRRKIFKKNVEKILVYASSPQKEIIGEIEIGKILNEPIDRLWEITRNQAGISIDFFKKYFENCQQGFAIEIKKFNRFKKPLDITDFNLKSPPQSYVYTP